MSNQQMDIKERLILELIKPAKIDVLKNRYGQEQINRLYNDKSFMVIGNMQIQSKNYSDLLNLNDYYRVAGTFNEEELEYAIKRLKSYVNKNSFLNDAIEVLGNRQKREEYNKKLQKYREVLLSQVKLESFRFLALGGAGEVGRSCYYVRVGQGNYFLLDMGIKEGITEQYPYFEILEKLPKVKAIFISHAHLDHYGLLHKIEYLEKYLQTPLPPIIMSKDTQYQISVTLDDLIRKKQMKDDEKEEIMSLISTDESGTIGNVHYTLLNSGHIRGSRMVLLEAEGDSILYTGDINFENNEIITSAKPVTSGVNTLITEATYSGIKQRKEYEERKRELINIINDSLDNKMKVIIPTFAIQRTELVLRILNDAIDNKSLGFDEKVVTAGLGGKFAMDYSNNSLSNIDFSLVKNGKDSARVLKDMLWSDKPQILVTGAGDMTRGASSDLLMDAINMKNVTIIIVGYQPAGSLGQLLERAIDTGKINMGDDEIKVRCNIKKVSLGGHATEEDIVNFIKKINPSNIIIIHSDKPKEFSKNLKNETGLNSVAAENLEVVFDYGHRGLKWLPAIEQGNQLFYCECGLVFTDYNKAREHFVNAKHREVMPYRLFMYRVLSSKELKDPDAKDEVGHAIELVSDYLKNNKRRVYGIYGIGDKIAVVTDAIEDELKEFARENNKIFEYISLKLMERPNQVYKMDTYKILVPLMIEKVRNLLEIEPFRAPTVRTYDPVNREGNFKRIYAADGYFDPQKLTIYISKTLAVNVMLFKEVLVHELGHYLQYIKGKLVKEDERDKLFYQYSEGFSEFIATMLDLKSSYTPIIAEPHKGTHYIIGLRKYKLIYDVFGMNGIRKAAFDFNSFKELSELAFNKVAYDKNTGAILLELKKRGIYKKIFLKKGFDPLAFYRAWNVNKKYDLQKQLRGRVRSYTLSGISENLVLQALAISLFNNKKVMENKQLLESTSNLLRYRLNLLFIFRKKAIIKSLRINEYVYGFDIKETESLLQYIKKRDIEIAFGIDSDGTIHYPIAEEVLELSPNFTEIYLHKMTMSGVLEMNYQGQLMGCKIHRRFDPLVRLVCPKCKSYLISQVEERVFECKRCGETFSYPQVEYYCRENHAFDIETSINQEIYSFKLTEEARKRIEPTA
ncbi:MAG: MBL fold metallo-hydrolase [Nitrososphaeria archaeon]